MSQDPLESPNSRLLAGDLSSRKFEMKRAGNATLLSILVHAGFVLLVLFAVANPPDALAPIIRDTLPQEIVWLDRPGPGGGGGGGGNEAKEPPRKAELKGEDKITVPTTKAPKPEPVRQEPPKQPAKLDIPAMQTATGVMELPGAISSVPTATPSQGSGVGGGAGTGRGTGIGSGQGSGLGNGYGGGFGGGAFRPGNGVESPVLVREVTPEYTADAMRMKVQGVVEVEAVVDENGTITQARIVRSLDDRWGLDQKALEAVRQWRFRPGTRQGKPVPVLVTIELTFTLR